MRLAAFGVARSFGRSIGGESGNVRRMSDSKGASLLAFGRCVRFGRSETFLLGVRVLGMLATLGVDFSTPNLRQCSLLTTIFLL